MGIAVERRSKREIWIAGGVFVVLDDYLLGVFDAALPNRCIDGVRQIDLKRAIAFEYTVVFGQRDSDFFEPFTRQED